MHWSAVPLLYAFLMISEMLLLQKQGAAFPQPSRAIYCGKVIISLYLKKRTEWSPCQNVGSEPKTAAVRGGAASHFQSPFRETRHWMEDSNKSGSYMFAEMHHDDIFQNLFTDSLKIHSAVIAVLLFMSFCQRKETEKQNLMDLCITTRTIAILFGNSPTSINRRDSRIF